MKLYISIEQNKIFISEKIIINCWSEYVYFKHCVNISTNQYDENMLIGKTCNNMLLMPNTLINNLWHLMHHLFALYKFITINNLVGGEVFPIFFSGFYKEQHDMLKCKYLDLLFTGFGFSKDDFLETYKIFKEKKGIEIKKLQFVNSKVEFESINGLHTKQSEPMFNDFKLFILNNYNIIQSSKSKKNVTFVLRRESRKILNIEEIQNLLKNIDIKYIFLEDYSIREQLNIIANTDIMVGVHGAGLIWSIFMKNDSLLIEIYPGNSNTDNYIRWCQIAKIKYQRLSASTDGDLRNFRMCNVRLTIPEINNISTCIGKNL